MRPAAMALASAPITSLSLLRHNMVELHVDTHMANRGSWAASTVTTVLSTAEVPGSQQQPAMLHAEAAAALALNA